MVRLLTTNICNAYLTQIVLSIAGGFEDPRLFLPGWIGIATVRPPSPRTRDTNGRDSPQLNNGFTDKLRR